METNNRLWTAVLVTLLVLLTAVLLISVMQGGGQSVTATPTFTPEPLLPTRTPTSTVESYPAPEQPSSTPIPVTPTTEPTAPATLTPLPTTTNSTIVPPAETAESPAPVYVEDKLARFGVCIAKSLPEAQLAYNAGLPFGSVLNWNVVIDPPGDPLEFWQMVRVDQNGIRRITWEGIDEAIAANPASIWMIGNEPDVQWQDNVTPERYSEIYHDVYTYIKARDPQAKVAIGGVSQPTPLRRAYLGIVLDTYELTFGEPMPIDIWNVHAFILREEADSWGVGIPPGMEGEQGILYEIEDHDDLDILTQNIIDFRAWMAERGYGDKPLVVSEYGILMPADYGFPHESVAAFMTGSFDLFRTLSGDEGFAPDQNRLVQWWFWYSMNDDWLYPTGNLLDSGSGQLTELGEVWVQYGKDNGLAP